MADAKLVGIIIKTPEELRVRIKTYAAQHRTSMQQVIIDAVVEKLGIRDYIDAVHKSLESEVD